MKPPQKKPGSCRRRKPLVHLPLDLICREGAAVGREMMKERVRQGLSQTELAVIAQVGRASISDLEAGRGCGPGLYLGIHVARALGFHYDVLLRRARVALERSGVKAVCAP